MSGLTIFSFSASARILRELEQAVRELASDKSLPVIARRNLESADPLWMQWQARSNLVAFVRPDGYVGWAAFSPAAAEIVVGVRKALGMFIEARPDRPQSVPGTG
jgi:hypothetical protein